MAHAFAKINEEHVEIASAGPRLLTNNFAVWLPLGMDKTDARSNGTICGFTRHWESRHQPSGHLAAFQRPQGALHHPFYVRGITHKHRWIGHTKVLWPKPTGGYRTLGFNSVASTSPLRTGVRARMRTTAGAAPGKACDRAPCLAHSAFRALRRLWLEPMSHDPWLSDIQKQEPTPDPSWPSEQHTPDTEDTELHSDAAA